MQIKNLTVTYGKQVVLDNVSFHIPNGKITLLQGESGSGKSSLFQILGFLRTNDTSFEYLYKGRNIALCTKKEKANFIQEKVAFIFQRNDLVQTLTVAENIALPLKIRGVRDRKCEKRIVEIAKSLGISNLLQKFPETLSGGQKQRVSIAKALIKNPEIILADVSKQKRR